MAGLGFFAQEARMQFSVGDPLDSLPARLAYAAPLDDDAARIVYAYLTIEQGRRNFVRTLDTHTNGFENDAGVLAACNKAMASYEAEAACELKILLNGWNPAQPHSL